MRSTSNTTRKVLGRCLAMASSQQFPPPPREMYRYHSTQRQSQSPNRAGPPPLLPERKPETQLSDRASRPSTVSRTATSSNARDHVVFNSNELLHHHVPQHNHNSYQNNSLNSNSREINQQPSRIITSPSGNQTVTAGHNDMTLNARRDNRLDVNFNSTSHHMFIQEGPVLLSQNNSEVRLRNDRSRERVNLPSQSYLTSADRGGRSSGAFHAVHRLSQPEEIFEQFREPYNVSYNRLSLMYVPPAVVPVLQTEHGRIENVPTNQQPKMLERNLMLRQQQKQQQYVLEQQRILQQQNQEERLSTNNQSRPTRIILDNLSLDGHYHSQQHQSQNQHNQPSVTSSHIQQRSPNRSSLSPASPSFFRTKMPAKPENYNTRIPPPHSPAPPPQVNYVSTRPRSSPSSTVTSEITKPGPSQNATVLIRPSPVILTTSKSVNQLSTTHKICVIDPNLHPYQYRHVDFQPIDNPHNSIHQVEAPCSQMPPPAPPLRTSTLLPPPRHSAPSPVSPGGRSSKPTPPNRQPFPVSRDDSEKPTADDLANVKLRAVTDSSHRSQIVNSDSPRDTTTGAATLRLRSTPGKFCNIYAEEETTLPPPPTLDYFDELPPPPPPHELLCNELPNILLDSALSFKHTDPHFPLHTHPHIPPGEANSSTIPHKPALQSQLPPPTRPSPKLTHQDNVSKAADILSVSGAKAAGNNIVTVCERQISGSMSTMDFEIPDDIDLSQCPGLVEINNSTPNWKRDMIEKKNQEKIEEYVKKIRKEREQEAKWKNVPEWKKKILQKKDEEEGAAPSPAPAAETQQATKKPAKKPVKKPPVPPPKESKEDLASLKPKGDIVPAALSIDPEELAAMPPWKRELLFKRDKVPVTFSNEFNPDDDDDSTGGDENTSGS